MCLVFSRSGTYLPTYLPPRTCTYPAPTTGTYPGPLSPIAPSAAERGGTADWPAVGSPAHLDLTYIP